jgi:hypothetical protein
MKPFNNTLELISHHAGAGTAAVINERGEGLENRQKRLGGERMVSV